ncbi:MAG: hypothetical protein G01um101419_101 [Parcubacteria group bacterium Gr01-1014_19]|nr:MAG: hypothetical protein G01um101419_101 [Parcubacteria group bacterium Gr01-1014_19]
MKKILIMLVFTAIMTVCLVGCSDGRNDPDKAQNVHPSTNMQNIVNYGNNIYYFPHVEASFGNHLATFLNEHKDLEVVSIAADDYCGHGYTKGYFVVFRKKQLPAENPK